MTPKNQTAGFVTAWLVAPWRLLLKRRALAAILVPSASIVVGLFHQAISIEPLGIPIFHLSSLDDYLAVGVRFLVILLLAVAVVTILIAILVCLVALVLEGLLSILVRTFHFLTVLLLVTVWGSVLYAGYFATAMVLWGAFKAPALAWRMLGAAWSVFHERGRAMRDAALQRAGTAASHHKTWWDRFHRGHEQREAKLTDKEREINEVMKNAIGWLNEKLSWSALDGRLAQGRAIAFFLWFVIGVVLVAILARAFLGGAAVAAYHEGHQVPAEFSWMLAIGPVASAIEWWRDDAPIWLWPYSEVDLRLRNDAKEQRNVLQIGGTSDFLLFWERRCDGDGGEPMIVPKASIAQILPGELGDANPDCGSANGNPDPPPPVVNCPPCNCPPQVCNCAPELNCPATVCCLPTQPPPVGVKQCDQPCGTTETGGAEGANGSSNGTGCVGETGVGEDTQQPASCGNQPDCPLVDVCAIDKVEWFDDTPILFPFNSADIGREQQDKVASLAVRICEKADEIRSENHAVVIEAGTDSTGRYLYNRDLSERRADAVQNALRGAGVDATIVALHGELHGCSEDLHGTDESRRMARVGICPLPAGWQGLSVDGCER